MENDLKRTWLLKGYLEKIQDGSFQKAIWIFIAGALLLKLFSGLIGPVHWDDNYYLNIGSHFLRTGGLTPYMWRFDPSWNIISGSGSGYGILFLLGWFKIFGLSVNSGHIFMYLVGILTLPILYLFVYRWYGKQAALWTVFFAAVNGPFFAQFFLRMDAPACLVYSGILLLYQEAKIRNSSYLHAAVGIGLIAALEFHILSLLYIGAFGLLYAVEFVMICVQKKRLVLDAPTLVFGTALLSSFLLYAVIHIFPNPDLYFYISQHCDFCSPGGILKEVQRFYTFTRDYPIEVILFSASLAGAFIRWKEPDRIYILWVGGFMISMVFLNPPASMEYTGHMFPLFAIGAGTLVAGETGRLVKFHIAAGRFAVLLGALSFLLLSSKTISYAAVPPRNLAASNSALAYAIEFANQHIPKDAVIMGTPNIFYKFLDYPNYLSHKDGTRFTIAIRGETYLEFWQRQPVQAFVGDPSEDQELLLYFERAGGFTEIYPEVWVSHELFQEIKASAAVVPIN